MPRRTDEEIRRAYIERIEKLQQKVKRIDKRTEVQTRKQRNHRLIIIGTLTETHALRNPRSDLAQTLVRLLTQYARLEDRGLFADLFQAVLGADEAKKLLGDVPAANNAESISDAAE
jgi:hypothetical protein